MSEDVRAEEKQAKRVEMVQGLGVDDLRLLSREQLRICQQLMVESNNLNSRKRIDEMLKDQVKAIAEALSSAPYVYTSPSIRIMAGFEARFSTLMTVQRDDAYAQLDRFMSRGDPSSLRISDYLNKHLLAHSLSHINDEEFGGVVFDADTYQALRGQDQEAAEKMLAEIRDKRLDAIGGLSPHVYDRLVEFYQAFQIKIEDMSRSEEMIEALGN